jgi:hypothetical protein
MFLAWDVGKSTPRGTSTVLKDKTLGIADVKYQPNGKTCKHDTPNVADSHILTPHSLLLLRMVLK